LNAYYLKRSAAYYVWYICVCMQCKKLPVDGETGDGYVTEEDETVECDQQRKTTKKVGSKVVFFFSNFYLDFLCQNVFCVAESYLLCAKGIST
jgi:hypothetical protein